MQKTNYSVKHRSDQKTARDLMGVSLDVGRLIPGRPHPKDYNIKAMLVIVESEDVHISTNAGYVVKCKGLAMIGESNYSVRLASYSGYGNAVVLTVEHEE